MILNHQTVIGFLAGVFLSLTVVAAMAHTGLVRVKGACSYLPSGDIVSCD